MVQACLCWLVGLVVIVGMGMDVVIVVVKMTGLV